MNQNTSDTYLKVITLNVRGLRDTKKRQSLVYWLKNKHIDIAFLQETYFNDKFCGKLDREWGNNTSFHNLSDSRHSRGIAILLSKNINVDEISCKM